MQSRAYHSLAGIGEIVLPFLLNTPVILLLAFKREVPTSSRNSSRANLADNMGAKPVLPVHEIHPSPRYKRSLPHPDEKDASVMDTVKVTIDSMGPVGRKVGMNVACVEKKEGSSHELHGMDEISDEKKPRSYVTLEQEDKLEHANALGCKVEPWTTHHDGRCKDAGIDRPAKTRLTERELGTKIASEQPPVAMAERCESNNVSRDSSEMRSDVSSSVISEIDRIACMVCDDLGYHDKMVLCDACSNGCHTFCMRPTRMSVPLGHWMCPECHIVAKRYRIHLSRMILLKAEGSCLLCAENAGKTEYPDKQCVDCKLNFHSECLLTERKLKPEQVNDPHWKCQVCVQYEIENFSPEERKEKKDASGQCHACSGFAIPRGVYDMVCAVCQLKFHRSCLQRLRKYTSAQLNDPRWTCVICSMQNSYMKDTVRRRRPFSPSERPQKRCALEAPIAMGEETTREVMQRRLHTLKSRTETLFPVHETRGGSSVPLRNFQATRTKMGGRDTLSPQGGSLQPYSGYGSSTAVREEIVVLDGSDMGEGSNGNRRGGEKQFDFEARKSNREVWFRRKTLQRRG